MVKYVLSVSSKFFAMRHTLTITYFWECPSYLTTGFLKVRKYVTYCPTVSPPPSPSFLKPTRTFIRNMSADGTRSAPLLPTLIT